LNRVQTLYFCRTSTKECFLCVDTAEGGWWMHIHSCLIVLFPPNALSKVIPLFPRAPPLTSQTPTKRKWAKASKVGKNSLNDKKKSKGRILETRFATSRPRW
jgi:hypothetical protein